MFENTSFGYLEVTLTLARHSATHEATVVIPVLGGYPGQKHASLITNPRRLQFSLWRVAFPGALLLTFPTFSPFHTVKSIFFSAVLVVLTLASFWIEAEISTRLSLECTLLICHSLYLQYMGLYLFNGGVNCPLIGKNIILIFANFKSL